MVNSLSKQLIIESFNTGLNTVDSSLDLQDSDLTIADNVVYLENGEAKSIDAPLPIGNYGYITVFADAGGGQVTVTSANHGLSNGDLVKIEWTTNYNGNYTVSNKTTDTFEITDTFVADDATGRYIKRIVVNSAVATKFLGITEFNNKIYAMISNGTEARLMKSTGVSGASGDWSQANAQDFTHTALTDFDVYENKLWFVNGEKETIYAYTAKTIANVAVNNNGDGTVRFQTTANHGYATDTYITIAGTTNYDGSYYITAIDAVNQFSVTATYVAETPAGTETVTPTNTAVLFFLNTSDALTGLGEGSGLEEGVDHIETHLERQWISKGNTLFVSVQYPSGYSGDWDASSVYTGADTAGYITIDDNTEDSIQGLKVLFSQLAIFRERSIHLVTGTEILTGTITKKTMARNGVIAPRTISKGDTTVYFLGFSGVKSLNAITVQGQTQELDSLQTLTIDRTISNLIKAISVSDKANMTAISHRDKFYISEPSSETIYVLDEIASALNPNGKPVWSKWDNHSAEVFLEFAGELVCAKGAHAYYVNADTSGDVSSKIKTKDFDFGDTLFTKIFDSLTTTIRTEEDETDVTLKWYLNGSNTEIGSQTISIPAGALKYNLGHSYNSGLKYNISAISFINSTKRKLLSGKSISFSLEASGTNRFQLSTANIVYEQTRRGG